MANKRKDITGNKYGKLTATKPLRPNEKGLWIWEFTCDCGNTVERCITFASKKRHGSKSSCGCDHHLKTHGKSATIKKLYYVWVAMRQRCNNPRNKDYPNYGGRGISVCSLWDNYNHFYNWALDNGYVEGLTIERVDVNLGYSPLNCVWLANEKQALNTRKIRKYEYKGEEYTIRELAELAGINFYTMKGRLNNYGWSVVEAVEGRR